MACVAARLHAVAPTLSDFQKGWVLCKLRREERMTEEKEEKEEEEFGGIGESEENGEW